MQLDFLQAVMLTIPIEAFVYWLCVRKEVSAELMISSSAILNLLTLPIVWYAFPAFIPNYWVSLVLSEITVFFLEAVLLSGIFSIDLKRALRISLFANASSFLLGMAIQYFL